MPNKILTKGVRSRKQPYNSKDVVASVARGIADLKSKDVYKRIKKFLDHKNILDVGVGAGGVFGFLKEKGFNMTGIDVADISLFEDTKARIYDGHNFPYQDNSFDIALIIQVLHHCEDGLRVLSEAKRVAKRVIVIEDTYRSEFERSIVSTSDKLGNWEFYEHNYHTAKWWKKYLGKKKYKTLHFEEYSTISYLVQYGRYVFFVIE
ncbi:hypothetical protein A2V49_00785 [candidate division WWE3 bacterium RBG_19FT_COMBO_34_6]|uniref:Methyltransferase type 11 domain-containing protein n=1 Tax=candidate division WWE3 bacterium RBG_19FT_COMBO_34_6 TaxID=1802612 RepID=A0A1F4UK81_UNCKA|nr:MAG: hypothetical protein A2V49_00785 [candidate division WWE3 bacterium RBG_19FT_COMBO_34_6]